MEFDSLTVDAVNTCLYDGIPFVLFALPGQDMFRFYASMPDGEGRSYAFDDEKSDCFFINFFDNDEPYTAGIRFDMDELQVLERERACPVVSREAEIRPRIAGTFRASYHDAFSRVIPRLKIDGGKVVLSRHRSIFTRKFPVEIAGEYFALTSSTFRYLCYTKETGIWLGSTPELLLETDKSRKEIRTMSLAGTRLVSDESPWDDKNLSEQSIVTSYISKKLVDVGLDVKIGELCELRFMNIKHLCNEITAHGDVDISELMGRLSPTPAVAGYPRARAIEEIGLYETHRRHCYGGYVGVRIDGDYHSYVNLRCAFMAPALYNDQPGWLSNLYAGGGIVSASNEDEEWNETFAKTEMLARITLGEDSTDGYEGSMITPGTVKILDSPMY